MVHQDPAQRPSASTLVHHPFIYPDSAKSKAQLRKELNKQKFKNEILMQKVKKYQEQIQNISFPLFLTGSTVYSTFGFSQNKINFSASKKFNRSFSSTTFF